MTASDLSILVSTNLNANLIRGKLGPFVELPEVREVILVQDAAHPRLSKMRHVALGRARLGKVAHVFLRAIKLCIQIARARPSLVMGIYMMPHGLLAYALGRLARRPVCIYVIGGPNEIIDGGYLVQEWQVRMPNKSLERLYLAVLRRTDIVIVTGTETKRYLASHGVDEDRIHVMSAMIDSRRFRPIPTARRDYDLILTAQLIERKRVDLFLRIVADLRRRHPGVRAAILGEGPLRDDLERLADDLGIGDRVDFLGFHEDTERYYTRAGVFVLTSSTEGLSVAMLEAMACGVPAVVPAVGDLADVVCNEVTGYLIEGHDQEAFVTALSHLLEDQALGRRLGENARATILRGYTVEDGARGLHAILERLRSVPARSLSPHHT